MFCVLYELDQATGLKFSEYEKCNSDCKYYQEGCSISKIYSEQLTKEKYSWRKDLLIEFQNGGILNKSKTMLYKSFLRLIHPNFDDLWIVNCDKDDSDIFFIYRSGKMNSQFNTLDKLNSGLINSLKYDGRKLEIFDFRIN